MRKPLGSGPSSPKSLSPQQRTVPVLVTAQACFAPAEIATTPLKVAVPATSKTSTGISESVVVPLPRFPVVLFPQHITVPALVNAQVSPGQP